MKKIMKQFFEGIISFLACMFFLGGIATVFGICIISVVKLLSFSGFKAHVKVVAPLSVSPKPI